MREVTNLNIRVAQDPLTCVVLGAGKILENIADYEKVLLSGHKD
jgi:actin-like ATPase involved in cell morphogenesis